MPDTDGDHTMTSVLQRWTSGRPSLLELLVHESDQQYHARRSEFLSSHALADFRSCPVLYRRKQLGLIPDDDRPAYVVGRAAHALILEGREAYSQRFAVGGGPVNPKTGEVYGPRTKAYQAWAATLGRPVLSDDQAALVERLALAVREHSGASALLAHGIAESVARADYCGVPCQTRVDWLHPEQGIVDLKTCDDLAYFEADARRYGYIHQLAFYRAVLARLGGIELPVQLIAVEKAEPFRCGVWTVSASILTAAERDNAFAIERLRRCRDEDSWPTGYEDTRTFDYL